MKLTSTLVARKVSRLGVYTKSVQTGEGCHENKETEHKLGLQNSIESTYMFKNSSKKISNRTSRIEINKRHDLKIVDNGRVRFVARAKVLARPPPPIKKFSWG